MRNYDWDGLFSMLIAIVITVLILGAIIFSFGAIANVASAKACAAATADMGFDHRYSFWTGCQIEVQPGMWIPLDSYRYIGE
jgi:hypothetical protein